MFEPLAQNPPRRAVLLVRTSMDDPLSMAGTLQAAVRRVEKNAPVYGVATLESQLGASLAQRRFQTSLLIGVLRRCAADGGYRDLRTDPVLDRDAHA